MNYKFGNIWNMMANKMINWTCLLLITHGKINLIPHQPVNERTGC